MKGLNNLSKEIHQTAVDHGWWEKEIESCEFFIALCHSELSEALEEYRNNKPNLHYADGKPEGIAVELADCVIRILDYCGYREIDIDGLIEKYKTVLYPYIFYTIPKLITLCHYSLSKAYVYRDRLASFTLEELSVLHLAECINLIKLWCSQNMINLKEVIKIKHEYNKTRPWRHNGKKI